MREIKLLDCTLRDGGYVNDWEFGHHNIVSMFERLVDSGVDIIEIGFIDDRRPFDLNRSIIPGTKAIDSIYGKIKKRPPLVFGMIDYEYCLEKGLKSVEFIKIDVEGNELNVLKGAEDVLTKYRPVVYSELLRKHAKRFDYHPDDVIALMRGYGYSCFTLRDKKLVNIETIDNVEETNFFFLSKEKHMDIINKYANRSN